MTALEPYTLMKEMIGFDRGGERIVISTLRRFEHWTWDAEFTIFDIHDLVKRFNAQYRTDLRMIRPGVADFLLRRARSYPALLNFTFPTGAAIAYEGPGKALGEEIAYTTRYDLTGKAREGAPRVILPTGGYEGKEGIALVVLDLTADDMKKDGKDIRIEVPDSRLVVVPGFPSRTGMADRYMQHPETTIPHGERMPQEDRNPDCRYLYRADGPYVGPISRNGEVQPDYRRNEVYAGGSPVEGIVVEIPEEDQGKIAGTPMMLDL